jgi:hypothetical protein
VSFPPGCAGFVKFRILMAGHPFLPVNGENLQSLDNNFEKDEAGSLNRKYLE